MKKRKKKTEQKEQICDEESAGRRASFAPNSLLSPLIITSVRSCAFFPVPHHAFFTFHPLSYLRLENANIFPARVIDFVTLTLHSHFFRVQK